MNLAKLVLLAGIAAAGSLVGLAAASASPLVYKPLDPNFGGNPYLTTFMLDEANLQNTFGGSSSGSSGSSGLNLGGTTIGNGPVIVINPPSSTPGSPTVTTAP